MATAIIMEPDIQTKLAILGGEAGEEIADVPATDSIKQGITHATGFIYNAKPEGGGSTRLFKVLQVNACRYSCKYCFTSCAIRRKRTSFKPDELATTFVSLASSGASTGCSCRGMVPTPNGPWRRCLPPSSGCGCARATPGYIHLKLIPGAAFEYVERAVALADRVSLNLEAPNQARLNDLAPDKEFASACGGAWPGPPGSIKRARQEGRRRPSLTTQFVVGAVARATASYSRPCSARIASLGCGEPTLARSTPIERSPFAEQPAEKPNPRAALVPVRLYAARLWLWLRRAAVRRARAATAR